MWILLVPVAIGIGIGFWGSWGASAAFAGGFVCGALLIAYGSEAALRASLRQSGLVAIERNGIREFVDVKGMTAKAFAQGK